MSIRILIILVLSFSMSISIGCDAFAYSLDGAKWPGAKAMMYSTGGNSSAAFDSAFVEAMNKWNGLSNFVYTPANGYKEPCNNSSPWYSGFKFAYDQCGVAFGESTLAVNVMYSQAGVINQAGTVFNSSQPWDIHDGDDRSEPNFDFRRVAAHELGHALGLNHDETYVALMNSKYSESVEVPQCDDINGLRAMYGSSISTGKFWSNSYGNKFGANGNYYSPSIQQTTDGGYILSGTATINPPLTYPGTGLAALKLNKDGTIAWSKTYSGYNGALSNCIRQTSDGGYIMTGTVQVYGKYPADYDVVVLKLNAFGTIEWQKKYTSSIDSEVNNYDKSFSIQQTDDNGDGIADDGFIVVTDFGLLKLNNDGTIVWHQVHGGHAYGGAENKSIIQQTSDGGFIVAYGDGLVKLNSDGTVAWMKKTKENSYDDYIWSKCVQMTPDGGYILAGVDIFAGPYVGTVVIKFNSDDTIAWQKLYSTDHESFRGSNSIIKLASDGGYIMWVGFGFQSEQILRLNADGSVEWAKIYENKEGDKFDFADIQQTFDGGYIVIGANHYPYTTPGDMSVLKLNSDGNLEDSCDLLKPISVKVTDTDVSPFNVEPRMVPRKVTVKTGALVESANIITYCTLCSGGEESPTPTPNIKANNSDVPITLGTSDTLSVNISLDAGSSLGIDCDWWVAADTPFGWFYYHLSLDWMPGLFITHQGPLFNLNPFTVFNTSGLPAGKYKFYFAVDTNMDGSLSMDQIYYDSVVVNISP